MKPLIFLLGLAQVVAAQSTISTTNRYAYSANAGWIDFRPNATDGVVVSETFLSGYAYAANFGWISFGDGTPDNQYSYSNSSDIFANPEDFGINISETGGLSGYAYSANIGWILFDPAHGAPILNFLTGQITGYAYSANIGWISLNTSQSNLFTTSMTYLDEDGDGIGDLYEIQHAYTTSLLGGQPGSDFDNDGFSDWSEYQANTNPMDAQDYFKIISQTFNSAHDSTTLEFTSKRNRLYRVEHNTDLGSKWEDSNLGTFATFQDNTTLTDPITFDPSPRRFFRVVAIRPLEP